jgi:hypothetical protein
LFAISNLRANQHKAAAILGRRYSFGTEISDLLSGKIV